MSPDDSGIIISTIHDPVSTSIPLIPSSRNSGAAIPNSLTSSQTASQNSVDGSSYNIILITNAASVGASLCVVAAYWLLRRKHARIMERTTLKLSLAMAMTDLIFHVSS